MQKCGRTVFIGGMDRNESRISRQRSNGLMREIRLYVISNCCAVPKHLSGRIVSMNFHGRLVPLRAMSQFLGAEVRPFTTTMLCRDGVG